MSTAQSESLSMIYIISGLVSTVYLHAYVKLCGPCCYITYFPQP